MKNPLSSLLASVAQCFYSARRAQPPLSPEQLRKALADMLADPQTRRLVLNDLIGTAFPIQGGAPCKKAKEISSGDFDASCGGGDYSFPAKLRIGTAAPATELHTQTVSANNVLLIDITTNNEPTLALRSSGFDSTRWNLTKNNSSYSNPHTLVLDYAGGSPALVVSTDGNVGIGVTSPDRKLDVRRGFDVVAFTNTNNVPATQEALGVRYSPATPANGHDPDQTEILYQAL